MGETKPNRMRGWKRIGIVVSVLWFFGFGLWMWSSEISRIGNFYRWQLEGCSSLLHIQMKGLDAVTNAEVRERRLAEYLAKEKACQAKAAELHREQSDGLFGKGIAILLAIDLGVIVFGWLVVWLVVSVVRWVRRGFAEVS